MVVRSLRMTAFWAAAGFSGNLFLSGNLSRPTCFYIRYVEFLSCPTQPESLAAMTILCLANCRHGEPRALCTDRAEAPAPAAMDRVLPE